MALTKISTGGVKDDAASQAKIADEAVDEARLQISNAGTNGQFLSKQSGNTGGLTWADVTIPDADKVIEGNTSVEAVDTGSDGHVKVTLEGTERVRVDTSGMIGVNMTPQTTASSTYMLQMSSGGTQCFLSLGNNTSGVGPLNGLVIGNDGGHAYLHNRENTPLLLSTNDLERFRVGSAGQLGIAGANYGSSGQVLTSGGASAAASWTTISAAPQITGTASGAIAANKPCIVHTDGTFKQVVATITPQTPAGVAATGLSAIDGQSINTSTASNGMAIAHDPVNDNFGFLWCQSSNVYFRLGRRTTSGEVDLTYSDTGGVLTVQSGHSPTMCFDSTKEQFVVFNTLQTDSTQVAKGYGYTNSNKNVIEQKWSLTIDGNQCQNPHLIFHKGINKPILVFRSYSDSKAYATIITIASDGASASITTSLELSGDTSDNEVYMRSVAGLLYDPDRTDKLYIATKMDHGDATKVVTLTVASTSLARAGDDQVVAGGTSDRIAGTQAGFVHDTNTGKDILIYKKNGDSFIYARVVTTSDTGVSVSSETALTSGSDTAHGTTAVYDETLEKIIVIFSDKNDSYKAKAFTIDTSSTNPSAGTISSALTNGNTNVIGSNNFVSDAVYDSKTKNVVWVGVDSGNNTWPRWWNLKSATQTTNMTTENFIGFADAAYSNSATATVNVVGNTTTQSSLTAGQKYFVTATGALSTTADIPSVEAGLALSATKLLIKPA